MVSLATSGQNTGETRRFPVIGQTNNSGHQNLVFRSLSSWPFWQLPGNSDLQNMYLLVLIQSFPQDKLLHAAFVTKSERKFLNTEAGRGSNENLNKQKVDKKTPKTLKGWRLRYPQTLLRIPYVFRKASRLQRHARQYAYPEMSTYSIETLKNAGCSGGSAQASWAQGWRNSTASKSVSECLVSSCGPLWQGLGAVAWLEAPSGSSLM